MERRGEVGVLEFWFFKISLLLFFHKVEEDSIIKLDSSKFYAIALGIQISLGPLVVK